MTHPRKGWLDDLEPSQRRPGCGVVETTSVLLAVQALLVADIIPHFFSLEPNG